MPMQRNSTLSSNACAISGTCNTGRAGVLESRSTSHISSGDNDLRIADSLDFQWARAIGASSELCREIRDFLDAQDTSHPFQLPQWSSGGTRWALLRHHGRLRCFAQCGLLYPAGRLLPPIRALTVNHGPVSDDLGILEIALRRLVRESRKAKVAYIDIAPEWSGPLAQSASEMLDRNGWLSLPERRSTLRLDLLPSPEALLASFRKTTRYEIRRSMKGVEVRMAREEVDHREFLRLYNTMADERRFSAENSEFVLQVLRWLAAEPDRGGLFLAHEGGILRGGVVIIRCGVRCWYVWGATSKTGKSSAGHVLQWRAIQWAKENGCREYDFCGFREGVSSGPALFKRGFCHRVVHFLLPHRYVVSQARLRIAEIASRMRFRRRA